MLFRSDVAQYYFGLRVLANACAKAGNYEFPSKLEKDTKVTFAPLDTNLDYADFAFRMVLKQRGSAYDLLKWLEERDLHTRGRMCNLMRGGYPQGEALVAAMKEDELKWSTAGYQGQQVRLGGKRERSRSPPRSGGAAGSGGPSRMKKVKKNVVGKTARSSFQSQSSGVRYANLAKGGKQICRSYNAGNCKGDTCPYGNAHVCSVIDNGKACGGKHPASNHRFGGQGR